MSDGQLALNTNLVSPGLFFKDSNGDSVKIGPVHVGTTAPNVTPGAGGQAGNSKGEAWLDTTATNPILKVWNGSAFVAVQPVGTGTVVSTTDTGTVTSTMILDGTILNADINASAAIVDTKLATIATAGKVSNSATTATNANTASAIVARDASGNFSAGTITAALAGNASTVTTNANLTGDVTSVGNATSIAAGVIVNADINDSAAIADTKLATISTAGKVSGSAITSGAMVTSGSMEIVNTSPAFRLTESDGTSTHSQTLLFRNADQFSIRTSDSAGVALSSDYLIPADASGATDHIWRIANTEKARLDSAGLTVTGDLRTTTVVTSRTSPSNSNTSATATASSLLDGLRTGTPTGNITLTLPTGADMDAAFQGLPNNQSFEWSVINLAAATHLITVTAAATGHTVVGSMAVAAATSGRFITRKTAADTFISYRIA